MMDQLHFALVGFDSVRLLIPQHAVATIEMIASLDAETDATNAVGGLTVAGRHWPVYAMSADFSLLAKPASTNKYCVAFDIDGQPAFALACDEVSSLTVNAGDELCPLQDCMRAPGSPFEGLLLRDGRVMLRSSERGMHEFLSMDIAA